MTMMIDSTELLNRLHALFLKTSAPEYYNDLTRATMQMGELKAIVKCREIVTDLANTTEPELKPCDPILMSYTMEEFLKVVDDAKCFGLEVVIHNGKPYYREIT